MKIDGLKRYQKPHGRERFDDLPGHLRDEAERELKRLEVRWKGQLPPWRRAILFGRAKDLVLRPRDSAWGRRMLAKVGGYARQRQCRLQGIPPTAKATGVRLAKLKRKKKPKHRSLPIDATGADPRNSPSRTIVNNPGVPSPAQQAAERLRRFFAMGTEADPNVDGVDCRMWPRGSRQW